MFCKEYMIDLNGTQAAIRAGYSENTATQIGSENLSKPYIQERLQALMNERASKVLITAEDVLEDIIKTRTLTERDDRHSERLKANELLGKHLAMWTDKTAHEGDINITVTKKVLSARDTSQL